LEEKSIEKIFISYSRQNSNFAHQLTTDLSKAGANVWFDQISIQTGEPWDSSIDKALDEADAVLLILSKASVSSENVLDEISFALEENKKIIPVLLERCDIPFRIKRLNYFNLSKDIGTGMKLLLNALNLNPSDDSKESWGLLEEIKQNTIKTKDISITMERSLWLRKRRNIITFIIAISIPMLSNAINPPSFMGYFGLWLYGGVFMVSLLLEYVVNKIFKRYVFGRRFIKRFGDIVISGLFILLAIGYESNTSVFLSVYFAIIGFFLFQIPHYSQWANNVAYIVNMLGIIIIPILSYGVWGLRADISLFMWPYLPVIVIAFLVKTLIVYLSNQDFRFSNKFQHFTSTIFFLTLMGGVMVLELKQLALSSFVLYIIATIVGTNIIITSLKTDFKIDKRS